MVEKVLFRNCGHRSRMWTMVADGLNFEVTVRFFLSAKTAVPAALASGEERLEVSHFIPLKMGGCSFVVMKFTPFSGSMYI